MRADFRALFEDADRKLASRVIRTLLEPDRRRQPRWTGADDHHVIRHRFAFAHKISPRRVADLRSSRCSNVLSEGQLDRKSVVSGKSVSVRVDLGVRRIITKKKKKNT